MITMHYSKYAFRGGRIDTYCIQITSVWARKKANFLPPPAPSKRQKCEQNLVRALKAHNNNKVYSAMEESCSYLV